MKKKILFRNFSPYQTFEKEILSIAPQFWKS